MKAFPEMGSSTWVRDPGNWLPSPHSPSRSASGRPQALGGLRLWEPGPGLPSPDWESITEAGWEHEVGELGRSMRGSRPVGALMHGLTVYTHTSDSHLTPPFTPSIIKLQGSNVYGGLAVPEHMNSI